MRNPEFLELIDIDPQLAFNGFYRFAMAFFDNSTPAIFRGLVKEDREDLSHNIISRCVENNFKILRKYRNFPDVPFSAWFYILVRNECLDHIRRVTPTISLDDCANEGVNRNVAETGAHNNPGIYEYKEVVSAIQNVLSDLGAYCQLLLQMASDLLKPRQMVLLLGMRKNQNKKISDDLRECRKKLENRLYEKGIDIYEYFRE